MFFSPLSSFTQYIVFHTIKYYPLWHFFGTSSVFLRLFFDYNRRTIEEIPKKYRRNAKGDTSFLGEMCLFWVNDGAFWVGDERFWVNDGVWNAHFFCLAPFLYEKGLCLVGVFQFFGNWRLCVACDSECGDADAQAGDGEQRLAAGFGGGTSCDDIVDEQYVFAFQWLGVANGEDAFHIFEAFNTVFVGLGVGVAYTCQVVADDGPRECLCYSLAEAQALVVAATAFLAAVQRHGDEDVDAVEEAACGEVQSQLSAHSDGKAFVAVVFYLVQNLLCVAALREEKQCRGVFYGDAAYEAFFDEIAVVFCREGFGQAEQASGTDVVFLANQRCAADAAEAREEEFDEVAKPSHRNGLLYGLW